MMLRSSPVWMFCPGDRPDRYARALALADVAILDLEDAVAPERKSQAREALMTAASDLDPERVIVRVNTSGTEEEDADLAMLEHSELRTVMMPKAVSVEQVERLVDFEVVALCETAAGIAAATQIASAVNCVAITWGAQDLAVDLNAVAIRDSQGGLLPFAEHARTSVRYAAAVAGIPAYDTVWIDIDDLDGVAAEARLAAHQGFAGKMVIHPRQLDPVREAFRPTEQQVAAAERVMAAARARGPGAVAVGGQMLDGPVVEQARRTLDRARR